MFDLAGLGKICISQKHYSMVALHEAGFPVQLIYGPQGHQLVEERIRSVARASRAFTQLRQCRTGAIGGLFPNLTSCRYDPDLLRDKLGIEILPIPLEEVQDFVLHASNRVHEVEQLRNEITNAYSISAMDEAGLEVGIRLHLALSQIVENRQLHGFIQSAGLHFLIENKPVPSGIQAEKWLEQAHPGLSDYPEPSVDIARRGQLKFQAPLRFSK